MNDREVDMQPEYDLSQARQGGLVPPKFQTTSITLPIETEILDWFREALDANGGGNLAQQINQILRAYITRQTTDVTLPETRLRQILREELQAAPWSAEKQGYDLLLTMPERAVPASADIPSDV